MAERKIKLPKLNCGLCGFKTCEELRQEIRKSPDKIKRCIHLVTQGKNRQEIDIKNNSQKVKQRLRDIFGRECDFILDSYENNEGPIEIIHPYNFTAVQKLKLKKGDIIIGRPLAAGCPVTHCGKVIEIDEVSGLIKWCVIGPLEVRKKSSIINIGSYAPVVFEGIVKESKAELKVGMRYYFIPRKCMLQWRHSGLIGALSKSGASYRVRIEGIFLG